VGSATRILFHCAGDDDARMQDAVAAALGPEHPLAVWPDVGDPATIRYAVAWHPPDDFFDGLIALEAVFALAAGVDQLLRHPGLPAHVPLVRLDDAGMGNKMAEYVLHGVLHAHRGWPDLLAAARQERWLHDLDVTPAGRFRVGILGAGTLATAVARRLVANGYPVSCWSRGVRALPDGIDSVAGTAALDALLPRCRVLVCLLPLTPATRGILDTALLSALPRGAFLVNVARGEHLVEADLLALLDADHLSGAMLDVFAEEPLPERHPFWRHPKVLVSPHVSAPSGPEDSAAQVADSLRVVEAGGRPDGLVDRARGY